MYLELVLGFSDLSNIELMEFLFSFLCYQQQKNLGEIKQILREAPLEENRKRELSCALHVYFKDWLYGKSIISIFFC